MNKVAFTNPLLASDFERCLFSSASAYVGGYPNVGAQFLGHAKVGAKVGAAAALVFAIAQPFLPKSTAPVDASKGIQVGPIGGTLIIALVGTCIAIVAQSIWAQDKMAQVLTGQSPMLVRAATMAACVGVPAFLTRTAFKSAAPGALVGALLYYVVGCFPVLLAENVSEKKVVARLAEVFQKCYPLSDSVPCTDPHGPFLKVWDALITSNSASSSPMTRRSLSAIKGDRQATLDVMDMLKMKQNLDLAGALWQTPLARIILARMMPK